jgi:hypothetical protein
MIDDGTDANDQYTFAVN